VRTGVVPAAGAEPCHVTAKSNDLVVIRVVTVVIGDGVGVGRYDVLFGRSLWESRQVEGAGAKAFQFVPNAIKILVVRV
jgi:hypothetical protein